MIINKVEINKKEYPVIYSYQALFWWADFIGIRLSDISEAVSDLENMSERKAMALMYSGLVAGAEHKGLRLDISFFDFQSLILDNESLMNDLGDYFRKDMEVFMKEVEEKAGSAEKKMKKS